MSRANSYMVSKWLQVWDTQLNTLPVPLPSLPNCRSFKPMCRPLPPYLLQRPCLLPSWKIGKTVSRQHGDFRLEIGVVHILKTSLKVFWYDIYIYIYSRYRKYCISKSMYIVYSHQTGSPFVSCWNSIISKRETTRFPTKQVLLRILNHAMAFPALSHGASPWVQMLKSSWSIGPFQGWNSEVRMESIWLSWFILFVWFGWFQFQDGFPRWIIMMESTSVVMIHSYYGSCSQLEITDLGKITKYCTTFPSLEMAKILSSKVLRILRDWVWVSERINVCTEQNRLTVSLGSFVWPTHLVVEALVTIQSLLSEISNNLWWTPPTCICLYTYVRHISLYIPAKVLDMRINFCFISPLMFI